MTSLFVRAAVALLLGATAASAQGRAGAALAAGGGKIWILNEAGAASGARDREPVSGKRKSGDVTGSVPPVPAKLRSAVDQAIVKARVPAVRDVDFALRVGAVVPPSIRLRPLPAAVLKAKPAWRGHEYFLAGDEIVVVQPTTSKIVEVYRYRD